MRAALVLGATGSIGRAALDVARAHPDRLRLTGLSAGRDARGLARAAREFGARAVALEDANGADELRERLRGVDAAVYAGSGAAAALARECAADVALAAISGSAGLDSTLAAVEAGKDIALANKEALVVAGGWFLERVRARGVRLLPVDSEHSALAQCMAGRPRGEARRLVLTASGGPFRGRPAAAVRKATAADALRHPTWSMGPKITIDSATLANKALEVIEAHWLFGVGYDRIGVMVHPQSLVHGWVEWNDGTLLLQASPADMRLPVARALLDADGTGAPGAPGASGTPGTPGDGGGALRLSSLTFEPVDGEAFPLFGLGVSAGRRGGSWPAAFSGANEAGVAALLDGRIPNLGALFDAVAAGMEAGGRLGDDTLEGARRAEAAARAAAVAWMERAPDEIPEVYRSTPSACRPAN